MAPERQNVTRIGCHAAAVAGQHNALKEVLPSVSPLKDAALALSADSTWAQRYTVESSDLAHVCVALLAGASVGGSRSRSTASPRPPGDATTMDQVENGTDPGRRQVAPGLHVSSHCK